MPAPAACKSPFPLPCHEASRIRCGTGIRRTMPPCAARRHLAGHAPRGRSSIWANTPASPRRTAEPEKGSNAGSLRTWSRSAPAFSAAFPPPPVAARRLRSWTGRWRRRPGALRVTTVLVIVDVQRDFCAGGPLAVPDADAILPAVNGLARDFRRVILTQDWHPPGHVSFWRPTTASSTPPSMPACWATRSPSSRRVAAA